MTVIYLPSGRDLNKQSARETSWGVATWGIGFLFLKQAKISAESFQRLIAITNGDLKLDAVVDGLRRLKMNS